MEKYKGILLGCGILQREVEYLIRKNHWPIQTDWLDSSLHINFELLEKALTEGLQRNQNRDVVIFYGCCHPYMDKILDDSHTLRTEGQNCVEMLLGREKFMEQLTAGAFFLMEDWAIRWDEVITKTFGGSPDIVKEIFQLSSNFLLCLRTPCSNNFEKEASAAGEKVGLPVRWMDAPLDHLEKVLRQALIDKFGTQYLPK